MDAIMPLYRYKSFTRSGKQVVGTIDAPTAHSAKELLQGQGLMPVEVHLASTTGGGFLGQFFAPKVEEKTVFIFTKQLSVLLRSGVPLVDALELLTEQFEQPFQGMLMAVKEGVKSGESLATQLAAHPTAFSNIYIQLVKAGEASGKLDSILIRLLDYMQRASETRKKIKKAMSKPIMMLGVVGAVVGLMLGIVVPRMSDMFTKSGMELPAPTQILLMLSNFVTGHYLLLIGGIVGSIVMFSRWKATVSGQRILDELVLKIPLLSYFAKTKAVVQFSQTLGMLMESGVNLAEALDIVSNIVENKVLTQKLQEARDNIIKEGKIARYLAATGLFPKMASYMISTGEESGKLAEMLLTVGRDYDTELAELTDSLTAKIDPIMTMVVGGIVMFIVAAIFLPMMQMGDISGV
jgi:type II secretory pathway component PulF